MKRCTKCKLFKPLAEFSKRPVAKDGLRLHCKGCDKAYKQANKERLTIKNKEYGVKRRTEQKERIKEIQQKYNAANRGKRAALCAKYKASKLQATPKWLTQLQKNHIDMFYEATAELTKELGVKMEVDHIMPLKGKNSCGLHVPWNLQILPKTDNCRKSNKV